jgi:hypothetical protein
MAFLTGFGFSVAVFITLKRQEKRYRCLPFFFKADGGD